jgi:hypothetical protein
MYRYESEQPDPPRAVNDVVVIRVDDVYEVHPALMEVVPQQDIPVWDTRRIVDGRASQVEFMAGHFAHSLLTLGLPPEDAFPQPIADEESPR